MTVAVDSQVFATLVGNYFEQDLQLFRANLGAFDSILGCERGEWGLPMQMRISNKEGCVLELEFRVVGEDD